MDINMRLRVAKALWAIREGTYPAHLRLTWDKAKDTSHTEFLEFATVALNEAEAALTGAKETKQ
jgi:hypothetical protein